MQQVFGSKPLGEPMLMLAATNLLVASAGATTQLHQHAFTGDFSSGVTEVLGRFWSGTAECLALMQSHHSAI